MEFDRVASCEEEEAEVSIETCRIPKTCQLS